MLDSILKSNYGSWYISSEIRWRRSRNKDPHLRLILVVDLDKTKFSSDQLYLVDLTIHVKLNESEKIQSLNLIRKSYDRFSTPLEDRSFFNTTQNITINPESYNSLDSITELTKSIWDNDLDENYGCC